MWFGGMACENISVGAGEWLSIGEGYAAYGVLVMAECTACACGGNAECRTDPEVEGCTAGDCGDALRVVEPAGGGGTCWNARVTSCKDIREGPEPFDTVGGGVSPSSDLTSGNMNGTDGKSSVIPSSEFTPGTSAFSDVCDHNNLSCSGSGCRTGDSFTKLFVQLVELGGVNGVSDCPFPCV